jgi:hypothetical protein
MNQVWSEGERNFIRENAGHLTDKQGAAKLSRLVGRNITVNAWRKQRQKMGISKKPGRGVCKVERKQEDVCIEEPAGRCCQAQECSE